MAIAEGFNETVCTWKDSLLSRVVLPQYSRSEQLKSVLHITSVILEVNMNWFNIVYLID